MPEVTGDAESAAPSAASSAGAEPSSSDLLTPDALRQSVNTGDTISLRRHLASGGNVDGIDSKGRNLLMIAASMGDTRLEVVRLLLAHGAKLETRQYQGITALMFACMTGAQLVVLTLLAAKADCNMRDERGLTALEYARLKGHTGLEALLSRQAVRADALSHATTRRATPSTPPATTRSSTVELEPRSEAVDDSSRTASTARVASHKASRSPLLAPEPSSSSVGPTEGSRGLSGAGGAPSSEAGALAPWAARQPELPESLLDAAQQGDCAAVRAFLASGGCVNAVDASLRGSMLHAVCSMDQPALCTILLEARADVGLRDANGCTALSVACFAMHESLVTQLLRASAEVNCQDAAGLSPLMIGSLAGSLPIVRALLEAHASRDLRDVHGETAIGCCVVGITM